MHSICMYEWQHLYIKSFTNFEGVSIGVQLICVGGLGMNLSPKNMYPPPFFMQ